MMKLEECGTIPSCIEISQQKFCVTNYLTNKKHATIIQKEIKIFKGQKLPIFLFKENAKRVDHKYR